MESNTEMFLKVPLGAYDFWINSLMNCVQFTNKDQSIGFVDLPKNNEWKDSEISKGVYIKIYK